LCTENGREGGGGERERERSWPFSRILANIDLEWVLRRIFGPKRDEVTGEWRKLHNKELNDLHSSANVVRVIKSRIMRRIGHVALIGEGRGVYRILVGKSEGKRPLGRPRRRWEDNIKMDIQEVGLGPWTGSSWLRIGTGGGNL
jgi:hypothetical protein